MSPVSLDTSINTQEKRVLDSPPTQVLKKPVQKPTKVKKRKYKLKKNLDQTSPIGVLDFEINDLIKEHELTEDQITNPINAILNNEIDPLTYHRIVHEVTILKLTSNGDGLALISAPNSTTQKQIVVVPFGIPGDIVTVKIFKTHPKFCESDLLKIEQHSPMRDNSLIKCQYFGACSGCQYQQITYPNQLEIKREVILNAYKFFAPHLLQLPAVSNTEPSPLQYSYRTKLTPHFDMPRHKQTPFLRPNLGFGSKGRPTWRDVPTQGNILDIEECIIGTEVINKGMAIERTKFEQSFNNYKKGATILLRENSELLSDKQSLIGEIDPSTNETLQIQTPTQVKTYVTKSRQIVKEIIQDYQFEFSAGEFFQNNNSILPRVIEYVSQNLQLSQSDENYLIDAYCGSGLFSITLAKSVTRSIGVEISADSVKFAQRNAELNNIKNCSFIVGKAEKIFGDIDLPNNKTSIILDPPRKGCDEVFLKQLSDFQPIKIIYISCNVHSQLRDLDFFLTQTENGLKYKVDSIKGFDFFPQTHHVESIAVLSLT